MESLRAGIRSGCGAPMIVQTLAAPSESLLGSYDLLMPGSRRTLIAQFNAHLLCQKRMLKIRTVEATGGVQYHGQIGRAHV